MDVIDGIFGLHARDRPRAREAWTPALEAAFVDLVQPRRGALAWVEGGVECDGRQIHIRSLSRGDLERTYDLYIRAFEVVAAGHWERGGEGVRGRSGGASGVESASVHG